MEKALKDADIEVAQSGKLWEAQRAYEKRLLTIMAKDKSELLLPPFQRS